ncbi:putative acetyltransferase [Anaerolinea thermophila UNI-1]|uniref:Acetyltransferase n=1 Tax=Anaerolinea thermophila (strain DSM 14523 / JCM 11388 / NBRC 100420 / UNI-1) TaxID=926569 RepID=E8N149_ANATU|nr:putative acetyltransferase [Anaerolinea thermophila UNI-1]
MDLNIEIREVGTKDISQLERLFPQGGAEKHARRLVRQQNGSAVYLIAFLAEMPVGHLLLKWDGARDEAVRANRPVPCPDLEDLFVREEYRQQGIATQLLRHAEDLARQCGYAEIGLAVGLENPDARRLYDRLGYREAGFGTYRVHGMYVDEQGALCTWEEECVYLVKRI